MSLHGYLQPCTGHPWKIGDAMLEPVPIPLLMGIVNTTPDSFFDGGQHNAPDAAFEHALRLLDEGATILDIGGESTRPGAAPVSAEEELSRVLPVVKRLGSELSRRRFFISIDTQKAAVAAPCLAAGTHIVNDVSALGFDADMAALVRDSGASVVLNHMRGEPRTMQNNPVYTHVVAEVRQYLAARIHYLMEMGIDPAKICIDPGVCFGKSTEDNLRLIGGVDDMASLGFPVLMGMSRKSYIGRTAGLEQSDRLIPSVVSAVMAMFGGATVLRVHDIKETREGLTMAKALTLC